MLSVVDAYTRECLALEVDTSFASWRVTRVLDQIIEHRGEPRAIRCDNGPELTSRHFLAWCIEKKIELVHIQPGKPTQNAHVESFHGRLREECLRISWFQNLRSLLEAAMPHRWGTTCVIGNALNFSHHLPSIEYSDVVCQLY